MKNIITILLVYILFAVIPLAAEVTPDRIAGDMTGAVDQKLSQRVPKQDIEPQSGNETELDARIWHQSTVEANSEGATYIINGQKYVDKSKVAEVKDYLRSMETDQKSIDKDRKIITKMKLPKLTVVSNGEADLASVLGLITTSTDFIIETQKSVDLSLPAYIRAENEDLEYILDTVLSRYGYGYRIRDKLVRVFATRTAIFTLPLSQVQNRYKQSLGRSGSGNSSGSDVSNAQGMTGAQGNSTIESFTSGDDDDIWKQIHDSLGTLVSDQGKFSINKKAGIVLINDYQSNITTIKEYLDTVVEEMGKQVSIKATIMEIGLTKDNEFGVEWNKVFTQHGYTIAAAGTLSPNVATAANIFKLSLTGHQAASTGFMTALKGIGDLRVTQRPHLTTLNRVPAIIVAGSRIPYISNFTRDVSGTSGTVTSTPEISYVQDGLTLTLLPTIHGDDVILNISPLVSRVDSFRNFTAAGNTFSNPVLSERDMSTTVTLHKDEILIIGGMILDSKSSQRNKTPVLSEIPLLGRLFTKSDDAYSRTELVIMVSVEPIESGDEVTVTIKD